MKSSSPIWMRLDPGTVVVALIVLCLSLPSKAQPPFGKQQAPTSQNQVSPPGESESISRTFPDADAELQQGTALTGRGLFQEAISHLLIARGRASNQYAADFNLALCYVGTGQFQQAIPILVALRNGAHATADVENLLAQAYVGSGQPREALEAVRKAAALTPQNEKLYAFVADACMDQQDYALGLKVVNLGLRNLPQSPRLHYERGIFLNQLEQYDRAKADFALVRKLAPESDIAYQSGAHEALIEGNMPEAIRVARGGIQHGHEGYFLFTILGEALIRTGASPGQPEFTEAQAALQKAVAARPDDPGSRIALAKLYLMAGSLDDAILHLEKARQLKPGNAAVYSNMAKAYQRRGDLEHAQEMLAILEKLNQAKADKIRSAPGDRKASYAGPGVEPDTEDGPPPP